MAHTASMGSAKRTVDVIGKRLGIKKYGSEFVHSGNIIMRQRGSTFHPGKNVKMGKDFTIYAVSEGFVHFRQMTGPKRTQKYIDVLDVVAFAKINPNFAANNFTAEQRALLGESTKKSASKKADKVVQEAVAEAEVKVAKASKVTKAAPKAAAKATTKAKTEKK